MRMSKSAIGTIPIAGTRREFRDDGMPGLWLTILPSGIKTWSARYQFAGLTRRFTIGVWPRIDNATARKIAIDVFRKAASGIDPQSEKLKQRARSKAGLDKPTLFGTAWDQYVKNHVRTLKASTRGEIERIGTRVLVPKLGRREVGDITPREAKALVKTNQLHSTLTGFFNWARNELIIAKSPLEGIRKPSAPVSRDRILTEAEIAIFWKACNRTPFPYGALFQSLLLTGARRGEIAGLQADFIDRRSGRITLPGELTKNGRPHEITITPQLEVILDGVELDNDLIFGKPSGWSKAKLKLDAEMATLASEAFEGTIPNWRLHDLRRTAASGMAALGVSLPVIERCLNHVSGATAGGIIGVYQRHEFRDEMAAAWKTWNDYVARVVMERR